MVRDNLYWAGYYLKRLRNEGFIHPGHAAQMFFTHLAYLLNLQPERSS